MLLLNALVTIQNHKIRFDVIDQKQNIQISINDTISLKKNNKFGSKCKIAFEIVVAA